MLVSSSDGFAREGLLAAILLRALMFAVVVRSRIEIVREERSEFGLWPNFLR